MWQSRELKPDRMVGAFFMTLGCAVVATILAILFFVLWLVK